MFDLPFSPLLYKTLAEMNHTKKRQKNEFPLTYFVIELLKKNPEGLTSNQITEKIPQTQYRTNARNISGIVSQAIHHLKLSGEIVSRDSDEKMSPVYVINKNLVPRYVLLEEDTRKKTKKTLDDVFSDDLCENILIFKKLARVNDIENIISEIDKAMKKVGNLDSVKKMIIFFKSELGIDEP